MLLTERLPMAAADRHRVGERATEVVVDLGEDRAVAGHVDHDGSAVGVELPDLVVGDDLGVAAETFDERSVGFGGETDAHPTSLLN